MARNFKASRSTIFILLPIVVAVGFILSSIILVIYAYNSISSFVDPNDQTYGEHAPRIEEAFNNLVLPIYYEEVAEDKIETEGNLTTSALTAVAKTYRVDMNMMDTKDELTEFITREEDFEAYENEYDVRPSMHNGFLGSDDFIDKCSPAQIPIKSGTAFMTIILSDTFKDSLIKFDGDGHVCNLQNVDSNGTYSKCVREENYLRDKCEIDNEETFVTIVVWVM